jgi:hypothetical protein
MGSFQYNTPDTALPPSHQYPDILQNMKFNNGKYIPSQAPSGVPLYNAPSIPNSTFSMYQDNGQKWFENDNTGQKLPYNSPTYDAPVVNSNNLFDASPQLVNRPTSNPVRAF